MEENRNNNENDAKLYGENISGPISNTEKESLSPEAEDIVRILKEAKLPERPARQAKQHPVPPDIAMVVRPGTEPAEKAAADADAPQVGADSAPDDAKENEQSPAIPSVHTLRDDLQGIVHDKKMSLVQAASLEQQKRRMQQKQAAEEPEARPRPKRRGRTGLLIGTLLLFVLGAGALGAVLYIDSLQDANPVQTAQTDSVIFAEQQVLLPVTSLLPHEIKQLLAQTRSEATLTLGAITQLIPIVEEFEVGGSRRVPRILPTAEFFTLMGAGAPDELVRTLHESFFLGIHTIDTNAPVLIFRVHSYERAFAGMLAWEDSIDSNLAPFFTPVSRTAGVAPGDSLDFQDLVVRNYDVRGLEDAQGNIRLLYAFPTPSLLVITTSRHTFTEVLSRLQAQRDL